MRSAARHRNHKNVLHLAFQQLRLPWIRKAFWLTVENHVSFLAEEKLHNDSALSNNLYYEQPNANGHCIAPWLFP